MACTHWDFVLAEPRSVRASNRDKLGGTTVERHFPTRHFNVDHSGVLLRVPPMLRFRFMPFVGTHGSTEEFGNVLSGSNIENGHSQKFFAGVAIQTDRSFIHFQEGKRLL